MSKHSLFLGRQPILDRNQNLVAYELLFRSSRANCANIADDLSATATVIHHVFAELGVERALGPYYGSINADEWLLSSDAVELLPANKIVLEILETVEPTPELVERCSALRQRGFRLALDDYTGALTRFRPLIDIVDFVKVDILPLDAAQLREVVAGLRGLKAALVAEKVDSPEQYRLCQELGFGYFQGYYFARPTVIEGRRLGQSELALMRLLGLLLEDADTAKIEQVFKSEPGLSLNLLKLVNSVACGLRSKVSSLRHAITVLGRRQLQRWLQLLLYTDPASGRTDSPLMQLAATRGRLLEGLARELPGAAPDTAFMVGIMSLMPALLGQTMQELLAPLPIASEISAALLERSGTLGTLLKLVETLEQPDYEQGELHQLDTLGLSVDTVNNCLAEAMAWAAAVAQPLT